jgi:hypothetical protein
MPKRMPKKVIRGNRWQIMLFTQSTLASFPLTCVKCESYLFIPEDCFFLDGAILCEDCFEFYVVKKEIFMPVIKKNQVKSLA